MSVRSVLVCSTCSTTRWAAHSALQPVAGEETSRQRLQERLIILVREKGEKKKKRKGWLPCRGWTPRRREQTGGWGTKVNSILDNTSKLSALWGAGRLKTPLRCYTECFRLFFVSQPLHCSMLHVQMASVGAYWEGGWQEHWTTLLHSSSLSTLSALCARESSQVTLLSAPRFMERKSF